MIVETIVTTLDEDGEANFAAMGVVWGEDRLVIRPYVATRTFRNLVRAREAVVNVTDDVLIVREERALARAVPEPARPRASAGSSWPTRATGARSPSRTCRGPSPGRRRRTGRRRHARRGRRGGRPFAGLCRAKHAVVEASILASRARRLPRDEVLQGLDRLDPLVDKTGGPAEREAMAYIRAHVVRLGGALTRPIRTCARSSRRGRGSIWGSSI